MAVPRVVVVHPPASLPRDFVDQPWFSDLGAVQLCAALESSAGAPPCEVALVDAHALPGSSLEYGPDERALLGAPVEEVLAAIDRPFDLAVVALTPWHRPGRRDPVLAAVLEGLRARSPSPLVLADLYQSGTHYLETEEGAALAAYPEADAYVKYEAETTIPALVAGLARGERPRGTLHGAPADLDTLPAPAWHLLDIPAFFAFQDRVVERLRRGDWPFPIDGRTLPAITSRGCPFDCIHCSSNPGRAPGEPKTQRRRPGAAVREVLRGVARAGATRVHVLDEMANVNAAHFDALLDETEALDLKLEIPNGLRADRLRDADFPRLARRMTLLSTSAESGVQRVADEIVGKRLDLAAIETTAQRAKDAGLPLLVHFLVGLPGETAQEINRTLALATDLHERLQVRSSVQFATPLPGTRLARGRALPVVEDWGPGFEQVPLQPDAAVPPDALRRFKAAFERRKQAAAGPQKVILNVTYRCNNHCAFCAVGNRTAVHGDPARQREHLERYRRAGVTLVDFDGGEPTLHPHLPALVAFARRIGYEQVNVTTNGRMLFYEDYARKLLRAGATSVLFSLHGPDAASHGALVGSREAFDQTVGGIRNVRRLADPSVELGVNVTLARSNLPRLGDLAQLVWDLGLRWMNIQFLTPFGRATRALAPDPAEAAPVVAAVLERWRERMKLRVVNLPFCFLPGHEEFLAGDTGKLERHMVFVNDEDVNLARYLAARRVRRPVCESCPEALLCGGFYELQDAPEPPWRIAPRTGEVAPAPTCPDRPDPR